ncbi:PREDICTED: serine/threonine-protein phosphatase CPPED1 isoform X3 [Bison bison bison]|uniref:Serine/threonine-protein phosphatase CPPED1 isoform X3 n=1 Tax=Bison bison bison TaxID=43346 RepID=A0A6P3IB91_BISBB|nr:PREDICTED: serine/threonine-protein phosphatase CPPED1 isoform X3 [Bison bison bison]XP_027382990.1 serine/threonine-protein phosphatase CPPED1 isoform X3 [Bos indicus x Bos taurus]
MSAAEAGGVFHRARGRTLDAFSSEKEREWKGPFYFIQGADPQFGLMKAWATGDCDNGGDEWEQEIRLAEQAVQAINKLNPKPKFFVLCGDLVHAMPGRPWRKEQTEDLQRVLRTVDSDIPLVLVSGNHDVGNVPTPETIAEFQRTWGDDYFSFWVGGVLFLVLNSQFLYDASRCPALKQEHDHWLDQQLRTAGQRACRHAVVFQHIPLFLQSIGEDDDYFNLTKSVRKEMADKFVEAGTCVHAHTHKMKMPYHQRSPVPVAPCASPARTAHFSSWEPLRFSFPEKWRILSSFPALSVTWQDSSCDNCYVSFWP